MGAAGLRAHDGTVSRRLAQLHGDRGAPANRREPGRGSTNGFFFTYSAQLAPGRSPAWYQEYAARYWQENAMVAGWREFSNREKRPAYYMDPDSGPVLGGVGHRRDGLGAGLRAGAWRPPAGWFVRSGDDRGIGSAAGRDAVVATRWYRIASTRRISPNR